MNVLRRPRRHAGAALVCALALLLTACGPPLPDSVVADSGATVGWTHTLTTTNPASADGATAGNQDVAAMTRGQFARVVDGSVAVNQSFGTVTITDPETFTVRYDLADIEWSDGIPLDAADLILAWAAGADVLSQKRTDTGESEGSGDAQQAEHTAEEPEQPEATDSTDTGEGQEPVTFDSRPSGLQESLQISDYDEFDRWIEVQFAHPIDDWQTALNVAVPAHVVGQRALGIDDPMAAKHAVVTAILQHDMADLRAIATTWNNAFDLPDGDGSAIPDDLLLSSGPYRITEIDQSREQAQSIRLVVNKHYTGKPSPQFETITLRHTDSADLLQQVGNTVDVVQLTPTPDNFTRVRDLERVDYTVATSSDRTVWALVLNVDRGEFTWHNAREAFLRAVPRSDVTEAAAGPWASTYSAADSLLFTHSADGYQIAKEDAGMSSLIGGDADEAAKERDAIGVDAGTDVCVLYDTDSHFATQAYAALKDGVAEAGWDVQDCGSDDVAAAAKENGDWDAALTRIPVPSDPAEIAAWWGSDGAHSLSRSQNDKRDELIAELARTPDFYAARELRVQIEATIVDDAVALPLAAQPVLTISARSLVGVQPPSGAPLTLEVADWALPDDGMN